MSDSEKKKLKKFYAPKLSLKISIIPILGVLLIVASFLIGVLVTKISYLENNQIAAQGTIDDQGQGSQPAPAEDTSPKEISLDDDPVLGDKNAPVTLVEFVDYECPFCKSFYDETFPQIKKDYIDTGKVKFVVRDLPLSFHQNAHKEAQAAECAREQGGDEAYFKYHDEIFKRTTSNGNGLSLDQLSVIAADLGLNGNALQSCLDTDKYKAEVDKDLADASSVGANGTPAFFIGKSTSTNKITGTLISGAQPLSTFTQIIDALIKK